jgi:molybdate transport system substrate-binding protein
VAVALGLASAACGDHAASSAGGGVTVSAAASLEEAFTAIGEDFESANPGTEVTFNFGSSGELATQIRNGAPADVVAFAATSDMTGLEGAGLLDGGYHTFATNSLVIVTKPGNPEGVAGLADLATVGTVSLCADTAPCGRYADEVLTEADVTIPTDRVTRGQDARATLSAVADGDAEAGLVYVTDAATAGDAVSVVQIAATENVAASYPIAVVAGSAEREASVEFVEFVLGPDAQAVLRDAGFGPP